MSILHYVFSYQQNYFLKISSLEISQLWSICLVRYHRLYQFHSRCNFWDRMTLSQFNVGSWHYVRPYSFEANSAFSLYSAAWNKNVVAALNIYKAFSFIAIPNGSLKRGEFYAGVCNKRTYKMGVKISFGLLYYKFYPWQRLAISLICRYNKTNVTHFSLNLLRIKALHVPSVTCSSSGFAAQAALGILRACDTYVSWLYQV
jgi:hypothetical protein